MTTTWHHNSHDITAHMASQYSSHDVPPSLLQVWQHGAYHEGTGVRPRQGDWVSYIHTITRIECMLVEHAATWWYDWGLMVSSVCVTTLLSSLERQLLPSFHASCLLPVQLVLYRAARQSSGRPRSLGVQSHHTLGNSSPAIHTKYMLDLLLQSGKAVSSIYMQEKK